MSDLEPLVLAEDGELTSTDGEGDSNVVKGLTILTASFFISGQIAGSGSVAIANALANTGWIGVPIMLLSAFGNLFISFLVSRSFEILAKDDKQFRSHMPDAYTTLIAVTLGRRAKIVTLVLLHMLVISAVTVYLLISAELMSGFINSFVDAFQSPNEFRVFVAIFAVFITPLTFFGTPKDFWGIALAAVSTTAISVILMIVRLSLEQSSSHFKLEDVPERIVTWQSFFSGLGTIIFGLSDAPLFPALYIDMKVKRDFVKAVLTGYFLVSLIFFPLSIYGFVILGDNLHANILTNLVSFSEQGCRGCRVLVNISQLALGFHFVFGYLLLFNPMAQELEGILGAPKHFSWQRCLIRSSLVFGTVLIAECVPKFGVILSLTGGTLMTILTYFLPVLAYLKIEKTPSLHMKVFLYELLGVTCICCIGSLYSTIIDIIKVY